MDIFKFQTDPVQTVFNDQWMKNIAIVLEIIMTLHAQNLKRFPINLV